MTNSLLLRFIYYRQTTDDPEEGPLCSHSKTIESENKLQACSHSTAISVNDDIQDLNNVKIISDKVCQALTIVETVCFKHLKECFSQEDVKSMTKDHLEEMKTFFLGMFKYKVTNKDLANCKVMEYVEKDVEHSSENVFESDKGKFLVELVIDLAIKATPVIFAFIII